LSTETDSFIASLPKAELHLHLEGTIEPETAVELAVRHAVALTAQDVAAKYAPGDFAQFIEAFKWVTSLLRTPADYALITGRLAEQLLAQNVVYAEVTLSVGVMLLRKQDPLANYAEIRRAAAPFEARGLRLNWIFDAARQFGVPAAMEVAKFAAECARHGVVAFGIGGDELAFPPHDFVPVYEFARSAGLQPLIHAGETGDAQAVRDAIEMLGAVRIGHGIAAMHDARLMDELTKRGVVLEICPTSNLRTGALARQLGRPYANMEDHPLRRFFDAGVPVTLASDDPAMFGTSLLGEYQAAGQIGMNLAELRRLVQMGFQRAFLEEIEKKKYNSLI
jgi:adenosine deaminase/aminodeoxyfutalosine deaminase